MSNEPGISHEELQKIEPVSLAFCAANQVKVGKKKLTFSAQGYRQSISFERGVAHTGHPSFNIEAVEEVPITQKCSLGHEHQTGKTERRWGQIQLSWEQAEVLIDWFQSGNWKQIREAAKIEKAELEKFRQRMRT